MMSEILWRLKNPGEFFWEPVRKWWHRNRQVRIERDYWEARVVELEGYAKAERACCKRDSRTGETR